MNLALWLLVGGFAGWFAFSVLNANAVRGLFTSVVIGICGGYLGGSILSPMMGVSASLPDVIDPITLIMALAFAAVCLTVGDMISRRFNV